MGRERFVEPAGALEARAARDRGDVAGEVTVELAPQGVVRPALGDAPDVRRERPVGLHALGPRVDDVDLGPRLEDGHLRREQVWEPDVVAVEARDVPSACGSET